ncbi:MAG: hypothetical protein AB1649_13865 [Chloroflexota bacterium]
MKNFHRNPASAFFLIFLLIAMACNLPARLLASPTAEIATARLTDQPVVLVSATHAELPTETSTPSSPTPELPTPTVGISHVLVPNTTVKSGELIHDAVSVDTAVEKRAPYGDSYDMNRFERPFLQDMTYVPDLDIESYNLSKDEKFYFVSIKLVGSDPNNEIGINYGVELDLDADGFGDYIIIAHPPYSVDWTTENVQVVQDTNRDTGGLSPMLSDAPLPGDGYDMVIFDGGRGSGDDPDLAWVRINAGRDATVQFAFKLGLAENRFMYGVIADAGPKNIADLDYVDRFTEAEAGSPETNEEFYPLKALYAVDNVCREAFGFTGTGIEPQRCPPKP